MVTEYGAFTVVRSGVGRTRSPVPKGLQEQMQPLGKAQSCFRVPQVAWVVRAAKADACSRGAGGRLNAASDLRSRGVSRRRHGESIELAHGI